LGILKGETMEKKVGVQIDKSLYADLSLIAKKQYRSTAALVRMILTKFVEEERQ
jgi:hypothetical protein